MLIRLRGEWETQRVWMALADREENIPALGDMKELLPDRSQKLVNHSPDGFMWSYSGSGPNQLALAILLELIPEKEALEKYGELRWSLIRSLPAENFDVLVNISPSHDAIRQQGEPHEAVVLSSV